MMGNGTASIVANGHLAENGHANGKGKERVTLTGYEVLREASGGEEQQEQRTGDTPNVKKRHRRVKSNGVKGGQDQDGKSGAGGLHGLCVGVFCRAGHFRYFFNFFNNK